MKSKEQQEDDLLEPDDYYRKHGLWMPYANKLIENIDDALRRMSENKDLQKHRMSKKETNK